MMNKTTIWNQAVETMNAFTPFYRSESPSGRQKEKSRNTWFALLKAASATHDPVTADQIKAATPYTATKRRRELLDCALQGGFLAVDNRGRYRLTGQGKQTLVDFFEGAQAAIAAAPVLPQEEMAELADLLERIVIAADRLPLPHSKVNFQSSRWTDPGRHAPAAVRVDQYMTDLAHFRADAHLASWNAYNIDGRAWETFTLIWRDQANTPADLEEMLGCCGYDETEYAAAIRLLLNKGWIEQAAGRWQISGSGRALRDVAEMVTNRLFFAAWQTLNEMELRRLYELLAGLYHSLAQAQPTALMA